MIVKDAISRSQDRFAVAPWVPGQSETGRHVVPVVWDAFDDPQSGLGGGVDRGARREQWGQFEVVPHAVVQGETRAVLQEILDENRKGFVVERASRGTHTLNKAGGK